jgi:hypothetical protein
MKLKTRKEIKLRLKAPMIALERVAQGQYLAAIFADAALDELRKIQRLLEETGKPARKRKEV